MAGLLVSFAVASLLMFSAVKSHHAPKKPKPAIIDPEMQVIEPDGSITSLEKYCTTLSDGTIIFGPKSGDQMFGTGKTCKEAMKDYKTSQYMQLATEAQI